MSERLKVLVLCGGPDPEHDVSCQSGAAVADALHDAGHDVRLSDIGPGDMDALDMFDQWGGDVVFPALHGPWGEGGRLQGELDARGLPYVGSGAAASSLCIHKARAKLAMQRAGLPTPEFAVLCVGEPSPLDPPVVVKPLAQGSSFDLYLCHTPEQLEAARRKVSRRHPKALVERLIPGVELTVGVVADEHGKTQALPPIHIIPANACYDYASKYERDDTGYLIGDEIDLPGPVLRELSTTAKAVHRHLGCRHLSRTDIILDDHHRPWVLEINTMPGFTSHSLVPKAAAAAGVSMAQLVHRLVTLAARRHNPPPWDSGIYRAVV